MSAIKAAKGAALALAVLAGQAAAESRAVVVANGGYAELPALRQSDAGSAVAAFKSGGFRVVEGRNLSAGDMRRAVGDLLRPDSRPGPRVVLLIGRFVHSRSNTWLLGREAGRVALTTADVAGMPVSLPAELMEGGAPHSVLLLGSDNATFPTGPGIKPGVGAIAAPRGVTVITGEPQAVRRAAEVLARPGATLAEALRAAPLRVVSGPGTGAVNVSPGGGSAPVVVGPRGGGSQPVVVPQGGSAPVVVAPGGGNQPVVVPPRGGSAPVVVSPGGGNRPVVVPQGGGSAPVVVPQGGGNRPVVVPQAPGGAPVVVPQRLDQVSPPGPDEQGAWTQAKRANSVAGYREFLQKYPQSLFAGAARGRMQELQAAAAPRANTPLAAEAALQLDWAERARIQRQLTLLTYDTGGIDGAFGQDTRAAIARFQRNSGLPATGYLTRPQIDLIARSAAARSRALESEARQRQAAADQADNRFWSQQRGKGAAGGQSYLLRYPEGLHAAEARALVAASGGRGEEARDDEAFWARARAARTAAVYREYLDKFPRGRHAAEASAALGGLQKQATADAAAEAALDLSAPVRVVVEQRLAALGFEVGPADGQFDARTRAAIRRYQATRNLRPSGFLNQSTAVRLLADTLLSQD